MTSAARDTARQWSALLFAPAVFLVHLEAAYAVVSWACSRQSSLVLYVITGLAVLLAGLGTLVGWRLMQQLRAPSEHIDAHGRPRFLAVTGFVVSAMCTLVLLAQLMAEFVLSPCQ